MINSTQDLISVVEAKLAIATDEEDKTKLSILKNMFQKSTCFFDINSGTALNILKYLGFNPEEANEIYLRLISPAVFQEIPKVRETTSRKM